MQDAALTIKSQRSTRRDKLKPKCQPASAPVEIWL
jgi:hypothetical protein